MLYSSITNMVNSLPGIIGVYYKDLTTGETIGINECYPFLAASVIKLPILVETYRQVENGLVLFDDVVRIKAQDKVPGCGSISYMHDELEVTVKDLCVLMIIQSDNTATNKLLEIVGIDNVNTTLRNLNFDKTNLNRYLFDEKAQKTGKENYYAPKEIGDLLEKLWQGEIVSAVASQEIIEIMKKQQINHKIPYYLPADVPIAHKTGEDSEITHDVAIVFTNKPFILCFASNQANIQQTEDAMRRMALLCYQHAEKIEQE